MSKYQHRRKKTFLKRINYRNLLIAALVVALAILWICMGFKSCSSSEKKAGNTTSATSEIVSGDAGSTPESTGSDAPAEPSEEADVMVSAVDAKAEDPLPKADENVLNNALFIGDSRMQGFIIYNNLAGVVTSYTATGLSVETAMTKAIATDDEGNACTIPQALQGNSKYDRVFVKLGVNELGWPYPDIFIEKYKELVELIKTSQPQAAIYIEAILPVTEAKSDSDATYNNTKIAQFNENIKQMTVDEGVNYLDCSPAVCDENGFLMADAATDGIHLTKPYCEKWLQYIQQNS